MPIYLFIIYLFFILFIYFEEAGKTPKSSMWYEGGKPNENFELVQYQ
jgi:hypothetical protein